MKKILHTLLMVFFMSNGFAQKVCVINKANAFYSAQLPGMQPVDENGLPRKIKPNVSRTIFITTNCNTMPIVSKISIDGVLPKFLLLKATVTDTEELAEVNNNKIYLNNKKGTFLWKIIIYDDENVLPLLPQKSVIALKWKNKSTSTVIKKWQELYTIPAP
jgi:hypothetical protein